MISAITEQRIITLETQVAMLMQELAKTKAAAQLKAYARKKSEEHERWLDRLADECTDPNL